MRVLIASGLLFLSLAVFAQDKGLSYFAGNWDFKIWFSRPVSGEPDLKATWLLEKGLDSAECYTGHVTIADKIFTRELIAFNPVTKQYTRTVAANNGAYIIFTTKGWTGNSLVWTGTQYLNGKTTEFKEEIVKSGDTKFKAVFYNRKDGKWEQAQTEVLTRIK